LLRALRHTDDRGAPGGDRGARGRAPHGRLPLGTRRLRRSLARVPVRRRSAADERHGLRTHAQLRDWISEALWREHDVFRSARGERHRISNPARNPGDLSRIARIALQPEVERVLHPALPGDPGHAIWKRDFTGACGLFGVVLKEGVTERALGAMIDGLELYGIGSSWGGFESLIVPFDPRETRSATQWPHKGPCFRIHAGLENVEDLIADLEAGFERLRST